MRPTMPCPPPLSAAPPRRTRTSGTRLPPIWLLLWLLALACQLAARPAHAADTLASPAASIGLAPAGNGDAPISSVEELRRRLDAVPQQLGEDDDGRKLLAELNAIGATAEQLVLRRSTDLTDLDLRLQGLGPAPEPGAPADTPDVRAQRRTLERQRAVVDANLKLARLLAVDAEQRSADVVRQRRALFRQALSARAASPLAPAFWHNLASAAPDDAGRLRHLASLLRTQAAGAWLGPQRSAMLGRLLLALALLLAGTWLAERILIHALPPRLPATRLRRTLLAGFAIVANVLIVGMALQLAWSGLALADALPAPLQALRQASLRAGAYAAFIVTLGHALLSRRHSSWRLLPIDDTLARRLSPFPWWLGLLAPLGVLAAEVNAIVGASLAADVLVHACVALLLSASVAKALGHWRSSLLLAAPAGADAEVGTAPSTPRQPLWLIAALACAGVAVAAALLAVALGYVALAGLLARQMVWAGVVLATTYLLSLLADDLCEALLSSHSRFGARLCGALNVHARLLDQAAVLASGALRLLLLFYMVIALMAPFGTSPDEVFRRGSSMDHSLRIGGFMLGSQQLLMALAVACVGFGAVRMFKHWLSERYFPHTALEPGMRSSIATLLGSVGFVFVVALALASLGISVERIAWVASALSVGIGFGLQAIVQNFIAGLILLAERPVKVGDWVLLGDTEGDVRRVNVRATEIQLSDRSTVIVPNSEFITKTVRNMTQAGAQGRVLLRLPAPLDADARRLRELILRCLADHPDILAEPAPSVTLEGIQSGTLTFLAIGYVANPRQISGVRSDVLFAILDTLRQAGLALSPPATTSMAPAPADVGMPPAAGDNAP